MSPFVTRCSEVTWLRSRLSSTATTRRRSFQRRASWATSTRASSPSICMAPPPTEAIRPVRVGELGRKRVRDGREHRCQRARERRIHAGAQPGMAGPPVRGRAGVVGWRARSRARVGTPRGAPPVDRASRGERRRAAVADRPVAPRAGVSAVGTTGGCGCDDSASRGPDGARARRPASPYCMSSSPPLLCLTRRQSHHGARSPGRARRGCRGGRR